MKSHFNKTPNNLKKISCHTSDPVMGLSKINATKIDAFEIKRQPMLYYKIIKKLH